MIYFIALIVLLIIDLLLCFWPPNSSSSEHHSSDQNVASRPIKTDLAGSLASLFTMPLLITAFF